MRPCISFGKITAGLCECDGSGIDLGVHQSKSSCGGEYTYVLGEERLEMVAWDVPNLHGRPHMLLPCAYDLLVVVRAVREPSRYVLR